MLHNRGVATEEVLRLQLCSETPATRALFSLIWKGWCVLDLAFCCCAKTLCPKAARGRFTQLTLPDSERNGR